MAIDKVSTFVPNAMPWSLVCFGNDTAMCLRAFSQEMPIEASVFILDRAPRVKTGRASRLVLSIKTSDGRKRNIALDEISENSQQRVEQAKNTGVIIVEEDDACPENRRFVYIAQIKQRSSQNSEKRTTS